MPQDHRPNPTAPQELSNRLGEQARDTLVRLVGQSFSSTFELILTVPNGSPPVTMAFRASIMKLQESQAAAADQARCWVPAALAYGPFAFVPIQTPMTRRPDALAAVASAWS
jgi:hypothetical protein